MFLPLKECNFSKPLSNKAKEVLSDMLQKNAETFLEKEGKKMKLQNNYFVVVAVALFLVFSPFVGRVYSADTIKIGFVAPLTGSFADDGNEMLRGVRMMVDERNAGGGVLGKKLEIVKGDIGNFSAEKIVSVGEKLVHQDKVDCLITQYLGGVVDVKTYGEYPI
jgi:hypothetical protein